ncbi:MAG: ATPase domain-containing protein [Thermoplasmatota archaeon]
MPELYKIELERDGLHRNLGGGFPKGAICMILGKYGSGKSAVSQRLLYGFLKNGHSVTMVSTEFTTKGFLDQMKSLDYNVVNYLLNKELLFIPVYPLIGRAISRGDFLGRVMNSKQLYERDITFFDTFSSLVKNDIDEERTIRALAFFKKLAGMNKTIILTMEEGELPDAVMAPFKSDADILISIQTRMIEGTTSRAIFVNRYVQSVMPVVEVTGFRIEPKVGFIIDITTVA